MLQNQKIAPKKLCFWVCWSKNNIQRSWNPNIFPCFVETQLQRFQKNFIPYFQKMCELWPCYFTWWNKKRLDLSFFLVATKMVGVPSNRSSWLIQLPSCIIFRPSCSAYDLKWDYLWQCNTFLAWVQKGPLKLKMSLKRNIWPFSKKGRLYMSTQNILCVHFLGVRE